MKIEDLCCGKLWKICVTNGSIIAIDSEGSSIALEENDNSSLVHGDVIEVLSNGRIIKLHDGWNSSALVFITNQCNSNCIMCPDSEERRTQDNTITKQYLKEYISLLPSDLLHVDITGGEPTLLKEELVEIIREVFCVAEHAEIQMLSNGRSFADRQYTKRFSSFSKQRFYIEIPIHADYSELHDTAAGVEGAFTQTLRGIQLLLKEGISVGIRVVVQKLNYKRLNKIVDMIADSFPSISYIDFIGLEVMGNAFKNKDKVWVEFDEVKGPLESAVEHSISRGIEPRLFNYPLCMFESKYWYCYKQSITDHKIRYPSECSACLMKARCGGFFGTTLHNTKYAVRPII